ncbi:hypothetical protein LCGC14_0952240 [marine sediment metagenome]|uniref:DUF1840 domain-containing protein n=1 Tax=marine sediment metagenome TaxID=412755 RepID=A0A0F9RND7_9ZZZZ
MIVTFKTKSYADITMFGDIAVSLLKMMGHSGTVPSAMKSADIEAALGRLKAGLDVNKTSDTEGEEEDQSVSLSKRALPLIALFESAMDNDDDVMWQ